MAEVVQIPITRKGEGRNTMFAEPPAKQFTAAQVRGWFVEAGTKSKRVNVPDDATCEKVAAQITELSRPRLDPGTWSFGAPEEVQLAKLLVRFTKRAHVFKSYNLEALPGTPLAHTAEASTILANAITLVLANNDAVKQCDPPKHTWADDARRIACIAHTAWATCCKSAPVNGGPGSPMATFVALALAALGGPGSMVGAVAIDKALRPPKKK